MPAVAAEVIVAGADVAFGELLLTLIDPIEVPPLLQDGWAARSAGPQRKNATEPVQIDTPFTVTAARSCTCSEPVPIETEACVMSLPVESCGVVFTPDWQLPSCPRTKLLSTALVEVDERLSASVLAKHSFPRPKFERSMPPS